VAKARAIPGLTAEEPYASAAAKILAVRGRELADHSRAVLDVSDIERVHDMRVATRRLRAALEVCEPCFPKKKYKSALAEVKALADALGERRDRDVAIATMEGFADRIAAPDRPGIFSLVDRFRGEQAEANTALEPLVRADRLAALSERISELVMEAESAARQERA
jgi:CHAD domain-containing protein